MRGFILCEIGKDEIVFILVCCMFGDGKCIIEFGSVGACTCVGAVTFRVVPVPYCARLI